MTFTRGERVGKEFSMIVFERVWIWYWRDEIEILYEIVRVEQT